MPDFIYNWTRYWCLRDGGYHVDGNGFLVRSEYFKDTFEFSSISATPCLILLGEPGIGKSHAVKDAARTTKESLGEDRWLSLDLRSFGDEGRLYDALFKSAEVEEWLSGSHRLHIFLDSFDECLLRIDTLAPLLADELGSGKYPSERLLLRIASRTADFPLSLENALREVWSQDEKVKVYELCPLQELDVLHAATINRLSSEEFFREVAAKNAGTLAARPITLQFLLDLYRKDNQLPDRLTDLYERGCRVLCDEQNEDRRRSTRLRGSLTADQKLIIAGRIAAVMVFCNKGSVWKVAETADCEKTDVLISDLAGFSESSPHIDFPVTEERVLETLFHTGLFNSRGAYRMGWAHQTFAEFLAAWYVARHDLEAETILSLIQSPLDVEQNVAPQLQDTAGWLAALRTDLLPELIKTDPILLLRSDVASFSIQIRKQLVDELLKIFEDERASDWGLNYQRLKHPDLARQLSPVIKDKTANYLARRFAIDAAEGCNLRALQNDLADLILDESEADYVRANAGYALWHIGDVGTRKRIKHLAIQGAKNDKDERVRGVALLCNWNENMSADEAFASIVHSPQLHDSYSLFLGRFTGKLRVEDLQVGLRWIKDNATNFEGDYAVERVIDEVMFMAWQNLETPELITLFAEASLTRLRSYEHDDVIDLSHIDNAEQFTGQLADPQKRRGVLKAMIPLVDEKKHDSFRISDSRVLQPRKDDLGWLLEQLAEAQTETEQGIWLQFLGRFYSGWEVDSEAFSILHDAYLNTPQVRKHYSWVFTPIELESPQAKQQKEIHERYLVPRREREERLKREALDPPPKETVLSRLNEFERGEIDAWWKLNFDLAFRPFGKKQYLDELQFDLKKLPGWQEASETTRARIIEAAKQYVLAGSPQNAEWIGTKTMFRPAFSGYRALYLLIAELPDFVDKLTRDVWRKWAAIIVSYPLNSFENEEEDLHRRLLKNAYDAAPAEVIDVILAQINAANDKGEAFYFSHRLEICWDEGFKDAFRHKLTDRTLKTAVWDRLLEDLLRHKDGATEVIAKDALRSFIKGEEKAQRALVAAGSLMQYAESGEADSLIWGAIKTDSEFGISLVESYCARTRPPQNLSEFEAADLYLWLVNAFPPAEDPIPPMGHAFSVTPRMEISKWRDSILGDLKQRGTPESLTALERIAATSPELEEKLHWILIEARQNVRRHTWKPPTPSELLVVLKRKPESEPSARKLALNWAKRLAGWVLVGAAIALAQIAEYAVAMAFLAAALAAFTFQIFEWSGFGSRKWRVRLVKVLWFAGVIVMLGYLGTVFFKMKGKNGWSNLRPAPQQNVSPKPLNSPVASP